MKHYFELFDRLLSQHPSRNQLCSMLAALLAREAIVRAMLNEEETGSSSSSSREVGDK